MKTFWKDREKTQVCGVTVIEGGFQKANTSERIVQTQRKTGRGSGKSM